MKRKTKRIIIIVICILILILFLVGLYFYGLTSVSKKSEKVKFNIARGETKRNIVDNLYEARLIKSKIATLIYLKLNNNIIIQAGEYELNRKDNTYTILNKLSSGDIIDNSVTITFIEGKRVTDYVEEISKTFNYSEDEIYAVLSDENYLQELINKYDFLDNSILNKDIYYSLEGYLFPAKYTFYKDSSIKDIFKKMLDKTANVLDNYSAAIKESGFSYHEILTMASIIENESKKEEDRPKVSQVIHKRLSINMNLGMDSTSAYGNKKPLNSDSIDSDVNIKNAYNTRNIDFIGLPVGPISNPGEDSIKAVLNPSDTNYIYFISDSDSNMYFTEDYNEFLLFKQMYS